VLCYNVLKVYGEFGVPVEIEKEILDYIHDYVTIDDKDFALLNSDFVKKELDRLSKIAHLGLMSKLRRLARHDKLEHAYGTYWLCKQCMEKKPRLVEDVVPFRLAGLLHGIGHAPFSYDTEYAIAKLYQVHSPTRTWVDDVFSVCCEFVQDQRVTEAARRMRSHIDYEMLHRWFGAFKIAKSSASELNTEIGKKVARILVDTDLFAHKLLDELDKLDYIPRDILYLAIGRIDLNFPLLLNQFDKGQDEVLIRPNVSSIIESTSDCLCDQAYLCPEDKCLRQLLEKCIVTEVMDGNHTVEELIVLDGDDAMQDELLRFRSGRIDLEEAVRRVKGGTIKEIVSMVGDSVESSLFDVEMDLVRTNRRGISRYHETKGVYVQCTPNPYYAGVFFFDWSISGFLASVAYDFNSKSPQNVITVLSRAEQWLPSNLYGVNASFGKDALRLLTGFDIETHLERYADIMPQIIKRHLKAPEEEWKKELFNKSWSLYEEAPQIFAIYEDDEISPIDHFLEFPQCWNTEMVGRVLDECRNTFNRMQKHRKGKTKNHDDGKDRLLEYLTYLETVLWIGKKGYIGWVLPSVWLVREKDKKRIAEIDVVALYVEKEFRSPVKIRLLEVSTNKSLDNKEENRKKLRDVAHYIRSRFPRKVEVRALFNGEEVVPPY
jgi:hypothetical protein